MSSVGADARFHGFALRRIIRSGVAQASRRSPTLFGGRSQLFVYHFMFGGDWEQGCEVCSLWADGLQGAIPHLEQRDVSFVMVSTAAWERLEAFRGRMGWRHDWYSAEGSDFNRDFHVSYSAEETEAGETFYDWSLACPV
ncbi:MAG: DUF899 family protein [Myxococcota bacterium]